MERALEWVHPHCFEETEEEVEEEDTVEDVEEEGAEADVEEPEGAEDSVDPWEQLVCNRWEPLKKIEERVREYSLFLTPLPGMRRMLKGFEEGLEELDMFEETIYHFGRFDVICNECLGVMDILE